MNWKELKAEGVSRCCAMFISGRQCARRSADQKLGGFCKKHGPEIARLATFAREGY